MSPLHMMELLPRYVLMVLGKEIAILVDEDREAGYYTTPVDGSKLSCGVYIFQLNAGSFSQSRKMVLMK